MGLEDEVVMSQEQEEAYIIIIRNNNSTDESTLSTLVSISMELEDETLENYGYTGEG